MLAVLLALSLGQLPGDVTGPIVSAPWLSSSPSASAAFYAPLLYSGDLPACQADTGCLLDVYATSTAVVAALADGGFATVNNATANGFEATPMVSGSGTLYAAKDITDATAPYISAADAQSILGTTFWSSDHTVMCAAAPTALASASPVIMSHALALNDGLYMQTSNSTATNRGCKWNLSGAVIAVTGLADQTSKWAAHSCIKSGTSFIARVNGTEASATDARTIANPAARNLYFGRYDAVGSAQRGPLYRCRFWNTALSSATKALREAQMLKGLAVRPSETYVTTVRASPSYQRYSATLIAASGDNVSIPTPNGIASFSATVNLALQRRDLSSATWTKDATTTVSADSASCPMSRLRDTNMDLVTNVTNTHKAFQSVTVTSSAGPFTAAFDVATTSGTGVKTVGATCGATNVATCTCVRDDGGACTATISTTRCFVSTTASTTPVRVSASFTCSAAVTTVVPFVEPGDEGVTAGSACYDLAQLTVGAAPQPYCDNPTQTASASCSADVHTVPTTGWPTTAGEISIRYTAASSAVPSADNVLIDSSSSGGSTNGVRIYRWTDNSLRLRIYDASGQVCAINSAAQTWAAERIAEARWTATTCELFLDGVSVASGAMTAPLTAHNTTAKIGASVGSIQQANGWLRAACVARPGGCP